MSRRTGCPLLFTIHCAWPSYADTQAKSKKGDQIKVHVDSTQSSAARMSAGRAHTDGVLNVRCKQAAASLRAVGRLKR
eukprot:scaffold74583_cov13-Tisochrysis_lutea.AAC.1